VAKRIAKGIRHSTGGYRFVKAMGLIVDINGKKVAQVSMNMTDFTKTPLFRVVETIRNEAARHGVAIAGSEIVGLVPAQALVDAAEHYLQLTGFSSKQILENKLRGE
jgi:glutamate formiminotransferase